VDEVFILQAIYHELQSYAKRRKKQAQAAGVSTNNNNNNNDNNNNNNNNNNRHHHHHHIITPGMSLDVSFISTATVPIIHVKDLSIGLEMDVSIYRKQALIVELLQKYLKWNYSDAHHVYAFLCAVKYWSKIRRINDAANSKMNSFGYVLMGIKYLQTLPNPVLPVLQVQAIPNNNNHNPNTNHNNDNFQVQTSIHPFCPFAAYDLPKNKQKRSTRKQRRKKKNQKKMVMIVMMIVVKMMVMEMMEMIIEIKEKPKEKKKMMKKMKKMKKMLLLLLEKEKM